MINCQIKFLLFNINAIFIISMHFQNLFHDYEWNKWNILHLTCCELMPFSLSETLIDWPAGPAGRGNGQKERRKKKREREGRRAVKFSHTWRIFPPLSPPPLFLSDVILCALQVPAGRRICDGKHLNFEMFLRERGGLKIFNVFWEVSVLCWTLHDVRGSAALLLFVTSVTCWCWTCSAVTVSGAHHKHTFGCSLSCFVQGEDVQQIPNRGCSHC